MAIALGAGRTTAQKWSGLADASPICARAPGKATQFRFGRPGVGPSGTGVRWRNVTLAVQCCNRGRPFRRTQKNVELTIAIVPLGRLFCRLAGTRYSCEAAISVFDQLNSVPSINNAVQNDREPSRDCNLCLAEPVALGEPRRASRTPAASNRYTSKHRVAALRDATCRIHLS